MRTLISHCRADRLRHRPDFSVAWQLDTFHLFTYLISHCKGSNCSNISTRSDRILHYYRRTLLLYGHEQFINTCYCSIFILCYNYDTDKKAACRSVKPNIIFLTDTVISKIYFSLTITKQSALHDVKDSWLVDITQNIVHLQRFWILILCKVFNCLEFYLYLYSQHPTEQFRQINAECFHWHTSQIPHSPPFRLFFKSNS